MISQLQKTIKDMLMKVKEKVLMELNEKTVICKVPCQDCDMKHIGETKRTTKKRLMELRYAVKKRDELNGIAVDVHKYQHCI